MLPAYQVNEASRYARVTSQTIRNWQDAGDGGKARQRQIYGNNIYPVMPLRQRVPQVWSGRRA